ncbi:unnamed protein product [Protopolystoma xenopodis]|uniref:Uncharacterized protein n=1 Tax=Protopolystoma xenopodis TaxID=117903 RepID=A0A3S5BGJ6_9PLAT|nr:unnamed protein product [Protopolystoma xenopodis]
MLFTIRDRSFKTIIRFGVRGGWMSVTRCRKREAVLLVSSKNKIKSPESSGKNNYKIKSPQNKYITSPNDDSYEEEVNSDCPKSASAVEVTLVTLKRHFKFDNWLKSLDVQAKRKKSTKNSSDESEASSDEDMSAEAEEDEEELELRCDGPSEIHNAKSLNIDSPVKDLETSIHLKTQRRRLACTFFLFLSFIYGRIKVTQPSYK